MKNFLRKINDRIYPEFEFWLALLVAFVSILTGLLIGYIINK